MNYYQNWEGDLYSDNLKFNAIGRGDPAGKREVTFPNKPNFKVKMNLSVHRPYRFDAGAAWIVDPLHPGSMKGGEPITRIGITPTRQQRNAGKTLAANWSLKGIMRLLDSPNVKVTFETGEAEPVGECSWYCIYERFNELPEVDKNIALEEAPSSARGFEWTNKRIVCVVILVTVCVGGLVWLLWCLNSEEKDAALPNGDAESDAASIASRKDKSPGDLEKGEKEIVKAGQQA